MLPPFPCEQVAGEKAGFRSQLLHALRDGLSRDLAQQGRAMPPALMVGVAVEQRDTIARFAHSKGHHRAIAQYAHHATALQQSCAQALAFAAGTGLHRPGPPLLAAIKLYRASLHGLAIDLQHCLPISSGQGS